jgi:hypothetical protein
MTVKRRNRRGACLQKRISRIKLTRIGGKHQDEASINGGFNHSIMYVLNYHHEQAGPEPRRHVRVTSLHPDMTCGRHINSIYGHGST